MQFLRIAAVLSLVAAGPAEAARRKQNFARHRRKRDRARLRRDRESGLTRMRASRLTGPARGQQPGELKLIAPAFVVVGNEDCPGCVPADSAGARVNDSHLAAAS